MSSEQAPAALSGQWFDGRSSAARAVRVHLRPGPGGPALVLQPAQGEALTLPHGAVRWPEPWRGRAPRRRIAVDLGAQGSLEIDDAQAWQAALAAAGGRATLAQRMQTRWTVFVAVLAMAAVLLGAFYRWGTPWAATQLTRHVPMGWEVSLAERALADLDQSLLKPSALPAARQAALRAEFNRLVASLPSAPQRYAGYQPRLQLQFRAGLGPNAFALPGGTIVMTDDMVQAAAKQGLPDDALIGVLAHEIGHVVHRHTTRMVVEQGVLNIGLGLALGDVSTLVSMGGSMLTGLAYRRQHETEADCFALALMKQAGRPTAPMGELLLHVDGGGATPAPGWAEWLSSHPDTPARAQALRTGTHAACAAD